MAAFDKTPPKNQIIVACTLLSAGALAALHPLFRSYFDVTAQSLARERREDRPYAVLDYRAAQAAELARGPMPIERAMATVAEKARTEIPAIAPAESADLSAVEGWAQMKNAEALARAQAAAGDTGALAADAGVDGDAAAEATDAGTPAADLGSLPDPGPGPGPGSGPGPGGPGSGGAPPTPSQTPSPPSPNP
jgi:hypothetical protein